MGGLSAPYQNIYRLNLLNPASLAYLETTALEVGLDATRVQLESSSASETSWRGNLSYLALGFPLINPINEVLDRKQSPLGLGMAFAIQPFTTVGYNIQTTDQVEGVNGSTSNALIGDGGIYRFSWSNAIKYGPIAGGLTIGLNQGTISNQRFVQFDSLDNSYVTTFVDEFTLSGFYWRFGLQYAYSFKKPDGEGGKKATGSRLIFGLQGSTDNSFSTDGTRFAERRSFIYDLVDTLVNETGQEGDGILPASYTFGITYEKLNKFQIGVEAGLSQWSNYENDARPNDRLQDSWHARIGGAVTPNATSYDNYFARVQYRFGAYYRTDPRQFEGNQLEDYGLSIGFGFPIILPRQRTSFIDLALEGGQFGLSDELQETYVRITLGFTLNDNTWFFKRKFN